MCVYERVCARVYVAMPVYFTVSSGLAIGLRICKYRSAVFVLKNTRYPLIAGRGGQHIFFKSSGEGKLKIFSGPGEGKRFFFWKLPKPSPVPITKYPTVPK